MLLNLYTIILPFLLSCTNRRCSNLHRMSARAYGSIKRKKERKEEKMTHTVMGLNRPKSNLGYAPRLFRNPSHVPPSLFAYKSRALDHPILGSKGLKFGPIPNAKKYVFSPIPDIFFSFSSPSIFYIIQIQF